jgi:protein SCO1
VRPALLVAMLALAIPSAASARVDPGAFGALAFHQHPGAQLPVGAELTDESGRQVSLASAMGNRPSLLVLEYLRCQNLCSLVLRGAVASLKGAQLTPGRQVNLIAISIDPRDTPGDIAAARAQYAGQFSDPGAAASGMHFLKGGPQQVAQIASAVGFPYRFDRASGQFAHPAGFVVTTPGGRISRYMLGLNPAPEALRTAVAEAGEGAVEPAAHPLLLLCFGYDPDEGSAAALAFRLVRYVSFAAILGLGLLIAFLSLRRRAA